MKRRPRILFLADLPPWPLNGGGQIKSHLTLRALSELADVRVLTFLRRPEDEAHLEALRPFCAEGIYGFPLPRARWRDAATAAWSLLTDSSFLMQRNASSALQQFVGRSLAFQGTDRPDYEEIRFDVIHADHLQMMQFVPGPIENAKIVMDCHNVEHKLMQQTGAAVGEWADMVARPWFNREANRLREVEREACLRADTILTVTAEDAAAFRALAPESAARVATIPIGVDTAYFSPVSRENVSPHTLLFLGTLFWPPNADALRWFCAAILPRIQQYIPDVRLRVVGARPTTDTYDLAVANPALELIPDVDDVRPYAATAAAFIAPIRFGGGMRVKTLCAMAMGLPVIATEEGAAGIAATHGETILLAKDADDFALEVVRVLSDPERADEMGREGRRLVEQLYAADAIALRLQTLYFERVLKQ